MEKKTEDIKDTPVLVPKKKTKNPLVRLFENKKKRYLFLILFILPFLILIGVFGYIAYKDAKTLLNTVTGETEVKDDHKIVSMKYQLRDDATQIQYDYFQELIKAVEGDPETGETAEDVTIAGLVCKNYVADFYTWTNKAGQYDVSALYYVYTPQKENLYLQARDGFYKYINNYINEYGKENLFEVESVEVTKTSKSPIEYAVDEKTFEAFEVTCTWTYKEGSKLPTTNLDKKMNFVVIKNGNRFEIVEASKSPIDIAPVVEQTENTEETGEANNG